MKRLLGFGLLLFLVAGCGSTMVHRINFSSDYKPDAVKRLAI